MYPNLFGNPDVAVYDLIGVLGYGIILLFSLWKRKGLSWGKTLLLTAVHLVAYTFAGARLAVLLPGRSTEFFGYLTISALGVVLASVVLGLSPLRQLDRTVPLYLTLAAVLKLGCLCAGCCHGYPWAYGLYNHFTQQTEFPVQLAEAVLYAVLLWALRRYEGRPGRRYALFLTGYAGVRFFIQFARADVPVFSPFHWMSGAFCGLGVVLLGLTYLIPKNKRRDHQV